MDAFIFRQVGLSEEVLYSSAIVDRFEQVEIQGIIERCRMADDSVVVINFQPMKSGNSMEDKTERILHLVAIRYAFPKVCIFAKG